MTIERAIEILDPEHREHYDSIEPVNEACRMGMNALKELSELKEKLESGRLVELPCKVGDIVWVVCGGISQYKITEFWYDGVFFNFRGENNEYVEEHKRFRFFDERIGKTVFLTHEEAEARLKELQEEKK